jgi:tetratricopeptide (TPR) repeat protein
MSTRFLVMSVLIPLLVGCQAAPRPQTVVAAKQQEDPFPFGKAEFKAKSTDNVLVLLDTADKYRGLCVKSFVEGEGYAAAEHFGRESKNWYRAVLEREPGNGYACLGMGYVDLVLGRAAGNKSAMDNSLSSAMSRFREALEKRPGYADAHLYIAQVHALRGEYKEAEDNLKLILNSGIENSQVHTWMAYTLFQAKKTGEGGKHVDRAIELDDPSLSSQWARENQKSFSGK